MERPDVKDVHEVEVIAKTLLDLEASEIQIEDSIIKPNNEPDVTVFGATQPVNSEMVKTDPATTQEHSSTENESPIKELLLESSTVSQEPLQEQTSASSIINEQTETNITSEVVVSESQAVTETTENVEPNLSEEPSICTNQVVVEKMDIDSEVITSSVEPPKNESMEEELVMVDMMSDVGVVEEVLESEAKIEPVESMELEPENDTVVEKG